MRTHGLLRVFLLAMTGLSLLHPVPAGAVVATIDTPDQSQATITSGVLISGTGSKTAQIVTAGQYGFLDRVSLYLTNINASASDNIGLAIQTVSSGRPSDTSIGFGAIPVSAVSGGSWVNVKISGNVKMAMTPGMQYAIVLSAPFSGMVEWGAAGNVYSGGAALTYSTASGWSSAGGDAAFRTYVIADAVDEIQSQTGALIYQIGTVPVGQTFTVNTSGILDRVGIYLLNDASTAGAIAISLRTVTDAGLPTETQVASGTIPASAMPAHGSYGWAIGGITPLVVNAGTKYALVLTTSTVGFIWAFGGDVYSGGSSVDYVLGSGGRQWSAATWNDGTFQTLVIPSILDQQEKDGTQLGSLLAGGDTSTAFIATWSGRLTHVGVNLVADTSYTGAGSIAVKITDRYTGNPVGNGTISAAISNSPAWYYASLSTTGPTGIKPAMLNAGTAYSIHLSASTGGINWLYRGSPAIYNYQTYMLPLIEFTAGGAPPPSVAVTPCAGDICPTAKGGFTPASFADGVTSRFLFQERADGSIQSFLAFNDPSPGGIAIKGCTSESAACRLTVKTFTCSDAHSLYLAGTYTVRGGDPKFISLTLSGTAKEPGTVTLNAGEYQYALTQAAIVDVTCPPMVGVTL